MAINPVGSVTNANATISLQDFMQVLMTQLTYQDPLKPMDNQEFLAQIAQFTNLQQTQQMNTNIQAMMTNQAVSESVGLIGKTVDITTPYGPQRGTVSSISITENGPTLTVSTSSGAKIPNVSLSQITGISSPGTTPSNGL